VICQADIWASCDRFCGYLREDRGMQDICAYIISLTTFFFAALPLGTAFMVKLSRCRLGLAGWRECVFGVGCAVVMVFVSSVVHFAFHTARKLSQGSAIFLVVNVVIDCALLALTLYIYRPIPLFEIPLPHQTEEAVNREGDGQELENYLGECKMSGCSSQDMNTISV